MLFIRNAGCHLADHILISREVTLYQGDAILPSGRHEWPFQFTLEPYLPSSTVVSCGAVSYNLQVTIVRSLLKPKWTASKPIALVRGLNPEAFEYHHSLEIEKTWPSKVMYSIQLPHKAFAAGDEIPVRIKVAPIAKGVELLEIMSSVKEFVTARWRRTVIHDDEKEVAKARHVIREGQAVEESDRAWGTSAREARTPPEEVPPGRSTREEEALQGDNEVDTYFMLKVPNVTAPSSSMGELEIILQITIVLIDDDVLAEPIHIHHRIQWSMLFSNPDGHHSELRARLPIRILAYPLLSESRIHSRDARIVLIGTAGDTGDPGEPENVDFLPSYASHVNDHMLEVSYPPPGSPRPRPRLMTVSSLGMYAIG